MSIPTVDINTAAIICQTLKDVSTKSLKPKVEFDALARQRRGGVVNTSPRKRLHRNIQDSDMCIKVKWDMFPQAPTLLHECFSCFESEEMFVTGLEEMAPSHRRESIMKMFSDNDMCADGQEASSPNRRISIVPRKRSSSDPRDPIDCDLLEGNNKCNN
jgi:hypothetical protein